ncbi:polysaccharide deacetylase family protein [Shimazuella kribbensis]|uniref:polysaccharide deacetylase family protein n=1 Tax=Shimazuella kribbensis TaxID=139808 RepID=UPI000400C341|nr:polysaccharide deacetylase family protein [Shimazuella kribbensis]
MSFFGRLSCLTVAIALVLTGCTDEESVKNQSNSKPVKYTASEFSQSMKLTQAKSLPVPKIDTTELKQKEALEATKMQNQTSFYRGSRYKKQVALTFDDGPDQHYTVQILDILKRERVKATFFVLGSMAKMYPSSLLRIYDEGHVISNHSWNHPILTHLSEAQVMKQIEDTNNVVTSVIGKTPLLVRPPYGALNKKLEHAIGNKGYKLIYWNIDTLDWDNQTADKIVATVKKGTSKGSIILQHNAGGESLKATVEALPRIIAHLRGLGYEFTTIDQLLHTPAYTKTPVLDPNKPVVKVKPKAQSFKSMKNNPNQKVLPINKKGPKTKK